MSTRYMPMLVRAYPDKRAHHEPVTVPNIETLLVDDTETTTDLQRLLFGSGVTYRVLSTGDNTTLTDQRIYLYYADDLEKIRPQTFMALRAYAKQHSEITLMSHSEYLRTVFLPTVISRDAALAGFNLSFDIWAHCSRVSPAKGRYYGGLSGEFLNGDTGIRYKETPAGIGMRRGFAFNSGSHRVECCQVVDCSQLSRAITGNRHSLRSAGEAAGCTILKYDGAEIHDPETSLKGRELRQQLEHYIGYNINDTLATADLWRVLTDTFTKHPIRLRQSLTFSPASISKQYLRDMQIHPPLCVCRKCQKKQLGAYDMDTTELGRCETAFYGARAECLIRLTELPGIVLDFTSEYPSVMILLGIWEMLTANRIVARDETDQVRELLDNITLADLYRPETWKKLTGFCDIQARDDLLPFRGIYDSVNGAPNIGLNYVTTDKPVTWTLPDIVAAKILTGKTPEIIRAVRYYGDGGVRDGLETLALNGSEHLRFNPSKDNLLKFTVQERQLAKRDHKNNKDVPGWKQDTNTCLCEACDRGNFLKVFSNAIFGIFGEMNHKKRPDGKNPARDNKDGRGKVCGIGGECWDVKNPEEPGEFCFPPFASLITGGGRLLLAMMQGEVHALGSEIIFCDTDSGCIPASQQGGEHNGVRLLAYTQVEDIRERFNTLNPYDTSIVPDLLKQEWPKPDDNSPVFITGISAKRYAVYRRDGNRIEIVKRSEHGLGLYSNPLTPDPEIENAKKPDWYASVWEWIIRTEIDGQRLPKPDWFWLPAVSVFPVRTQHVWSALQSFNTGKSYYEQMRPFGFHLSVHPSGMSGELADGSKVRLVGAFTPDSGKWPDQLYVDVHTGKPYRITTDSDSEMQFESDVILVKDYNEVVHRYIRHPEIKYDGPNGKECDYRTRGVLQPCHVTITGYEHITKDTGSIEAIDVAADTHDSNSGSHRVYNSDAGQRLYRLAREFYKAHGVGYTDLSCGLTITIRQARDFMSSALKMPGEEVTQRAINYATEVARRELGLPLRDPNALFIWADQQLFLTADETSDDNTEWETEVAYND